MHNVYLCLNRYLHTWHICPSENAHYLYLCAFRRIIIYHMRRTASQMYIPVYVSLWYTILWYTIWSCTVHTSRIMSWAAAGTHTYILSQRWSAASSWCITYSRDVCPATDGTRAHCHCRRVPDEIINMFCLRRLKHYYPYVICPQVSRANTWSAISDDVVNYHDDGRYRGLLSLLWCALRSRCRLFISSSSSACVSSVPTYLFLYWYQHCIIIVVD